ncbi:MAG: hypothetical protein GWN62_02325, partial [Aliifodinibius sp.]|nr:hypothetical protein [Fodinibius sp.]
MFPIARMLPPTAGFKYPYTISQSCMFDSSSSTRMEFTPSAAGTEETWTFSAWIKRSTLGSVHQIINAAAGNEIQFTAANKLQFTTATGTLLTTQVFRDCSNWYNIIVAVDTTQATAADRVNIYVNGSAVSDFDTETYMNQNEVTEFFKAAAHTLGANEADTEEFDGYMAQVAFIDGTQYAASDFGETKNGIWVPKDITGLTYGSQGSLLAFATAANLGDDTSGNTNDWTESNFGTDHQVSDSPTNNYCMLDYNAMRSNMTALKEGGLSPQDAGAAWHSVLGTFPLKSGKWYFEVDVGGDADDIKAGIVAAGEYSGDIITADTDPGSIGYILHCDASGAVYNAESSGGATGDDNLDAPAVNDVMTIAIDCDNGKIWFGMKNAGSGHVWGDFGASGVGDPANGTNPA